MSKISDIFDLLNTQFKGVLSTHFELSNPFDLEDNDDLHFQKGYALSIGPGVNNLSNINSFTLTESRDFIVTLTRETFSTFRGITNRQDTEKQLFEDQYLINQLLENDPHLGNPALIVQARYNSDGGLEFVRTENLNLLVLNTNIRVEFHSTTRTP